MKRIAFFDSKSYDIKSFTNILNERKNNPDKEEVEIKYFESKLNPDSASLAKGFDVVCAFVNDNINNQTIDKLHELGIEVLLMRSAGYNNVDVKSAYKKIHILRVPAYSPNAVAEHAMALLLSLNRHIHKAYVRTRDFNFNLQGLTGFDLVNKTIGVIGTGKIGYTFIKICLGFGMKVIAYDPYPNSSLNINYVSLEELFKESDIISLHCPLTDETKHMINHDSINKMKDNVVIINTSRGGLIDTKALLEGLKERKIKAAGLDVYEEESNLFFEDNSNEIIDDDILQIIISLPNVIITSHQGYLTEEALDNIAKVTLDNLDDYYHNLPLKNEICYHCKENSKDCYNKKQGKRCW